MDCQSYLRPWWWFPLDWGKREIKKATLNFFARFWWTTVCCWLCLTVADNLLTYYGALLFASLMNGYDIDFAAIIRYELHVRAFIEWQHCPSLTLSNSYAMKLVDLRFQVLTKEFRPTCVWSRIQQTQSLLKGLIHPQQWFWSCLRAHKFL